MRKTLALILALLTACSFLSSCRREYGDTGGVVSKFLDGYGVSCLVYSSLADEGSEEYISSDMRKQMFANEELLPIDYTLALHSRLDSIFELGVFRSSNASLRLELRDMCLSRVKLLESLSEGDGRVLIENDLVIYIFSDDIENALDKLRRVL